VPNSGGRLDVEELGIEGGELLLHAVSLAYRTTAGVCRSQESTGEAITQLMPAAVVGRLLGR
jgi:hypothetical protein